MSQRALLALTAVLLAACEPKENDTVGGPCEYEVTVTGTCTFEADADGVLSLTFETDDGVAETRVLDEWDAGCLTESGAEPGDVLPCAEWENTVGACSPTYLEVEGPLSSCEMW